MVGQMVNKVNAILNRSMRTLFPQIGLNFFPKQLPLFFPRNLSKPDNVPFYTLFLINDMEQPEIDVHKSNPQLTLFC